MVCVFDNGHRLEVPLPVDPFNGGEINICDGLDNGHCVLQPPRERLNFSEPGSDGTDQYALLHTNEETQ